MNLTSASQKICSLFEKSCYEIFQDYGHNVQRVYGSGFDTSDIPSARIDGGNEDFEILISIHIPFSTLALTYPVGGSHSIAEDELEDWISELANRLLGKLNGKTSLHNCSFKSGLPEFSQGADACFYQLDQGDFHPYLFILEGEMFALHLSIEAFNDEVQFTTQTKYNDSTVSDGDIEFF